MKRIIEDDTPSGLDALRGERVTFFCLNYLYTGKLIGVNEKFVLLEDPSIVYETGPFTTHKWQDAQALPHELFVMLATVESFGLVK